MAGEIKHFKTLEAKDLWRKILSMLFETGHPWVTFKDPCNIRSPQGHVGTVHSSNLCTEITLNTNEEEIAVCNLGSINLPQHVEDGKINVEQLKKSVTTAIGIFCFLKNARVSSTPGNSGELIRKFLQKVCSKSSAKRSFDLKPKSSIILWKYSNLLWLLAVLGIFDLISDFDRL